MNTKSNSLAGSGCSSHDLFAPFYAAPVPSDRSSMVDILKAKLADAAEKQGYRDGKEGVTIPPAEWSDDNDEIQTVMRKAWARGCRQSLANVNVDSTAEAPQDHE